MTCQYEGDCRSECSIPFEGRTYYCEHKNSQTISFADWIAEAQESGEHESH